MFHNLPVRTKTRLTSLLSPLPWQIRISSSNTRQAKFLFAHWSKIKINKHQQQIPICFLVFKLQGHEIPSQFIAHPSVSTHYLCLQFQTMPHPFPLHSFPCQFQINIWTRPITSFNFFFFHQGSHEVLRQGRGSLATKLNIIR